MYRWIEETPTEKIHPREGTTPDEKLFLLFPRAKKKRYNIYIFIYLNKA